MKVERVNRAGDLTIRTVLLAGMKENPVKLAKVARTKLWKRKKRRDPEWREKERLYRNEWRRKNPEKFKAQMDRYRERHRERLRKYHQLYAQRPEQQERRHRWYMENKWRYKAKQSSA